MNKRYIFISRVTMQEVEGGCHTQDSSFSSLTYLHCIREYTLLQLSELHNEFAFEM